MHLKDSLRTVDAVDKHTGLGWVVLGSRKVLRGAAI